jgi:integral membrane protein
VRQLHLIGRIEGTSLLVLLGLAMPLKYVAGQPLAVTIVGAAHGLLWIAYLLALAMAWKVARWPFATAILGGVASVVPFGPWWFETHITPKTAEVEG